jgi:hypothetical protein
MCPTDPAAMLGGSPLRQGGPSVILYSMPLDVDSERVNSAVFRLGPMDGQEHPIERATDELSVVMSDGQQHRYVRTDEVQHLADGRLAVVFDWEGRYYGPK